MADPAKKKPTPKTRISEGFMSTGLSSAVQRRHQRKMEAMKSKRAASTAQIAPQADIILDWIKKEKKKVDSFEKMALDLDFDKIRKLVPLAVQLDMSNKDLLQAQIIAKYLHLEWLTSCEIRANRAINKAKAAVVQGESFDEE